MATYPIITKETTHGHAAFLYSSPEERLELIAHYFQEGLAKNELCIYVTSEQPDDVAFKFIKLGFNVRRPLKDGALRIFEMNETYLPNGHFVADFMLANVSSYIEEAKELGHTGLRTAGEMSWIYDHPKYSNDAREYEARVNELSKDHPEFVGLCMYPVHDHFARVIHDTADTHPSFIHDGKIQLNPMFR